MNVKSFIPLPTRRWLKWAYLAIADAISPVRDDCVPSRRSRSIGNGDFVTIGRQIAKRIQDQGLAPGDRVLDIGCGQGRVARALRDFLITGHYLGFDVDADAVAWCSKAYSSLANFKFQHIDAYNPRYNPAGSRRKTLTLPVDDASQDCVIMTSVLTHIREAEIETYLGEIARILRPDGFALVTVFLRPPIPEIDRMGFDHPLDSHSYTTTPRMPEASIAVDNAWFETVCTRVGLKARRIDRGRCFKSGFSHTLQDYVVLELV